MLIVVSAKSSSRTRIRVVGLGHGGLEKASLSETSLNFDLPMLCIGLEAHWLLRGRFIIQHLPPNFLV
jgi:hypothetical protein